MVMREKELYRVKFEDGTTTTFHLNNLSGSYYAELATGKWDVSHPKYTAETVDFEGETRADIMEQVEKYLIKARPSVSFSIKKE